MSYKANERPVAIVAEQKHRYRSAVPKREKPGVFSVLREARSNGRTFVIC
jgi:hypothetical protein